MEVSVVIPSYNRAASLRRLLSSVAEQTYGGFEVIVVDDASERKDLYEDVIEDYRSAFAQLRYLRNSENRGAPASRNRGIREAHGELIALVDDDDEWKPKKLEKQVELIRGCGERVGLVYTWADAVDEQGNVVHRYRSEIEGVAQREILRYCFIPSPSVMVRKRAIIEAGLFDEDMPSLQDRDMWTRMFLEKYSCRVVKENLAIYHDHAKSSIGTSADANAGYVRYLKKYWSNYLYEVEIKGFFWTLWGVIV